MLSGPFAGISCTNPCTAPCAWDAHSAQPRLVQSFPRLVFGQADDWLPGGVLLLGVEGPRPHARGPAELQLARAERPSAGCDVGVEEVPGLDHGGERRVDGRGQPGDDRFAVGDKAVPVVSRQQPVAVPAQVADQVDRRVVASPEQVRALLAAVETGQPELTAFFGCLYYAYLRPGEAVYLRETDCVDLPSAGWGELLLTGNAPHAGTERTDAGTARDERHLKHRAQKATRPVPIPSELVELIRRHMDRFGTARDGRLFHAPRGGMLGESTYGRIWRQARIKAFTASRARSPLAARPYDLRHSGVTLALNAGVPAPEVARRAGHGVEVLLRVYAGCIEGQAPIWNRRIDDALHDDDDGERP